MTKPMSHSLQIQRSKIPLQFTKICLSWFFIQECLVQTWQMYDASLKDTSYICHLLVHLAENGAGYASITKW